MGSAADGVGRVYVSGSVADQVDVGVGDVVAQYGLAPLDGFAHDLGAFEAGGGMGAEGKPAVENIPCIIMFGRRSPAAVGRWPNHPSLRTDPWHIGGLLPQTREHG